MFPIITDRKVPPVSGVDLEHALNYSGAQGIPLEWFYTSFTYPRSFYQQGARVKLERVVKRKVSAGMSEIEKVLSLLTVFSEEMPHYSVTGINGATDRGMSEEDLLESGGGWCNEQARVFLALTQIAGIPSRLVFASIENVGGHVLSEVFIGNKWVLSDQTEAYLFAKKNGSLVNIFDFKSDPVVWQEVDSLYKSRLMQSRLKANSIDFWDKYVPYGLLKNPLHLFDSVGYCNYFIH